MTDERDAYGKLRALIANRLRLGFDDADDIAGAIEVLIDARITLAAEQITERLAVDNPRAPLQGPPDQR